MSKVLIYSHDTYGLGHLRRATAIAAGLVAADMESEALIVTGSPLTQTFRLPPRVDTVKLPTATKTSDGGYASRALGCELDELVALRSRLLWSVVDGYRPDVVLVDHAPSGMAGELSTVLQRLSSRKQRPRLVLGLREIIDDAQAVDSSWSDGGVWDIVALYDEVLVYGDDRILSTASELDLEHRIAGPVTHVGYIAVPGSPSSEAKQGILVTAGGGGDGHDLMNHVVDYLEQLGGAAPHLTTVVTGPLLSRRRKNALAERIARIEAPTELLEFAPDMRRRMARASGVVSMAGYNTVVEELTAEVPALLVPRVSPRREQIIRAERVAPHAPFTVCHPERMTADAVTEFVGSICDEQPRSSLDLGGVERTAAALLDRMALVS